MSNLNLSNVLNAVKISWENTNYDITKWEIKRNETLVQTILNTSTIVKNGFNPIPVVPESVSMTKVFPLNEEDDLYQSGIVNQDNWYSVNSATIALSDPDRIPSLELEGNPSPYTTVILPTFDISGMDVNNVNWTPFYTNSFGAFSNDGVVWRVYNTIGGTWEIIDIADLDASTGMTKQEVNALTKSNIQDLMGVSQSLYFTYHVSTTDGLIENLFNNDTFEIIDEFDATKNIWHQYTCANGFQTYYFDSAYSKGTINNYQISMFEGETLIQSYSDNILTAPNVVQNPTYEANGYNILFSWGSVEADGYRVYDDTLTLITETASLSYYVELGIEGTKTIYVSAFNAAGESDVVEIIGKTIPYAPENLVISQTSTGILLSWDIISTIPHEYKISYKIDGGAWIEIGTSDANEFLHEIVVDYGSLYEYKVVAFNDQGESSSITWGLVAIDSVTVSAQLYDSENYIKYSWNQSVGADKYVLRITNSEGTVTDYDVIGLEYDYVFTGFELNQSVQVFAVDTESVYGESWSDGSNVVSNISSPRNLVQDVSHVFNLENYHVDPKIVISFKDNSIVESGFRVRYKIDEFAYQTVNVDSTSVVTTGDTYTCEIPVSDVVSEFRYSIAHFNNITLGQYTEEVVVERIETVQQKKYFNSLAELGWLNTDARIDSFLVYSDVNGVVDSSVLIPEESISIGDRYLLEKVVNEDSLTAYLVPIESGKQHFPSSQITVTSSDVHNIELPEDFSGELLNVQYATYTWTHNDINVIGYKFKYSVNGGATTEEILYVQAYGDLLEKNIFLVEDGDSVAATIIPFSLIEEGQQSSSVSVTYIAIDPVDPSGFYKTRGDNTVTLYWDFQDMVNFYRIYYEIDGVEYYDTTVNNSYEIPFDDDAVAFSAYIVINYYGNVDSNPSSIIAFNATTEVYDLNLVQYNETEQVDEILSPISNKNVFNHVYVNILVVSQDELQFEIYLDTKTVDLGKKHVDTRLHQGTYAADTYRSVPMSLFIYNATTKTYDLNTSSLLKNTKITEDYEEIIFDEVKFDYEPLIALVKNQDVDFAYPTSMSIKNEDLLQSSYIVWTSRIHESKTEVEPIHVDLWTRIVERYYIHTEVHKVRICTIGDSIFAGHPGYWAENEVNGIPNSGTGDITSQFQYWLQRRLGDEYEVLNNGYGSDTTLRCLNRFQQDVINNNPQYVIIQAGTNDLYWAMAENKDNQEYLDWKMDQAKINTIAMVDLAIEHGIIPIIGTLIPRTTAQGIYRAGLMTYNEWILDYANSREDVYSVDFFNAGKNNIPPTPLEEPGNPGALNPLYDGDSRFDEYGNLIRRGSGVHPDSVGFRIMAEAIPLSLFQTMLAEIKMYIDRECTIEEEFESSAQGHSIYTINLHNLNRGRIRETKRYIKNTGSRNVMYAMYPTKEENIDIQFSINEGEYKEYVSGRLDSGGVHEIEIKVDVPRVSGYPELNVSLASRSIRVVA